MSPQPSGLEPLLSIETLAEYVGVPVVTIYRWRTEGKGPSLSAGRRAVPRTAVTRKRRRRAGDTGSCQLPRASPS